MSDPWAKDCSCVTHTGPHWLHMYAFDLRRLREARKHFEQEAKKMKALPERVDFSTAVLAQSSFRIAVQAMAETGVETYREARLMMQAASVDRIPPELLERAIREWDEPPEEARRSWAAQALARETADAPKAPVETIERQAREAAQEVDTADSPVERAQAAERLRQAEADLSKAKGARRSRAKFAREQVGLFDVAGGKP